MALGGVCAGVTSDTSTPSRILLDIIIPYYNKYQVGIPNLNTQGTLPFKDTAREGPDANGATHTVTQNADRGRATPRTVPGTCTVYTMYGTRYIPGKGSYNYINIR